MERALFGLTPGEFWVLNYLILLGKEQGSNHIILPRPGEDPRAEAVYSRDRLKRLLKSLKSKRSLTNLLIPKTKNRQIEVFLPARFLGAHTHPKEDLRVAGAPKLRGLGAPAQDKSGLGAQTHPKEEAKTGTCGNFEAPKLSFIKLELEKLIKLKQKNLNREIPEIEAGKLLRLRVFGEGIIGHQVRGRVSEQAKLFAVIRFIQSEETIEKPGAWLATVARDAELIFSPAREGRGAGAPAREGRIPGRRRYGT